MESKRVLLKLSGASFASDNDIFDINIISEVAKNIKALLNKGYDLAIVVGGGNIWRGNLGPTYHIDAAQADYLGMQATIYNAHILNSQLNLIGVSTSIYGALKVKHLTKKYCKYQAIRDLKKHKVVILAGGTGKPFCSTDTAAALRAKELKIDMILMGKNGTDGVYDKDPNVVKKAKKFAKLTFAEVLRLKLNVADLQAMEICKNNHIKMCVFNINDSSNILNVVDNPKIGTIIEEE